MDDDFEIDGATGGLMRNGEVIAKYTLTDGKYTVFPVAPSVASVPHGVSKTLMGAFNEFAHNCRRIEEVKQALGLN